MTIKTRPAPAPSGGTGPLPTDTDGSRRGPVLGLLLAATICLPLLLLAANAWLSWHGAWQEAEAEVTRTADAAAEYARRVLDGLLLRADQANALLSRMPDAEIRAREEELHAALRAMADRTRDQGAVHVFVHDSEARSLLSGVNFPVSRAASFAHRAYNQALREAGASPVHLGQVSQAPRSVEQSQERGFVIVARRREGVASGLGPGDYHGVVAASAETGIVGQGLRRLVSAGMHAVADQVSLHGDDGTMLAQSSDSSLRGEQHLAARRQVEGWPAFVSVARPHRAVLARWREAVTLQLAFGVPASLALVALAATVRRRTAQLARANLSLASRVEERSAALQHSIVAQRQAERRHTEVLASMREVIYALDADTRFAFVSQRAREVWRREDAELVGRPFLEMFPVAAESLSWQVQQRALAARQETHVCVVSPVIGRWIEVDVYPRQGGGITVAFRDIEDLRALHRERAASERRLRLATAAGRLGTFLLDMAKGTVSRSGRVVPAGGALPATDLPLEDWLARVHPEDLPAVRAALAAIAAGRTSGYQLEYRFQREVGDRWIIIESHAVVAERDPATGRPQLLAGVSRDVTAERAAEERQRLMAREVDHRAKNALAVVQAALRLTPRQDAEAYAVSVEGRVAALARAHSVLAEGRWQGAALRAVIEAELAAFQAGSVEPGGSRFALEGPNLALAPDAVQALSMALHELATNAAKHGALSAAQGRILVTWRIDPGAALLHLTWAEQGGPPLDGPPTRRGFGSRLVEATIANQLGGSVERGWEPSGLVCRMALPLPRIMAGTSPPRDAPLGLG
ncbi:HWE histidine kinase domain-containing protein [Falsiroseomonas sp. HC035]|uniref:HWE histidine kinase domain-containing protein n=1 Tax=Falsiroseomonas sp. HC035 TaxID=3390999 RepID=UPI003D31CBA2